ncbi:MAG: transketolase [Chlamydiales bacterium]|nr:transketolase [Chlamydiales bacterium]
METAAKVFLEDEKQQHLQLIANNIRSLSIDAIQKANSGHPGMPLGCAEIGAFLFGHWLNHYPKDPRWGGRDRFILSAGHGSMLLYSCLHLAHFPIDLDDIKSFRQLHSKTPGHPEFSPDEGVETTTGPLGQGFAHAVGQALGLKILHSRFDKEIEPLFNSKVYALVSDGDMMEGVASEASSFAGHIALNNLVVIYDSNSICLDGSLDECYSDEIKSRYKAYGWEVYEVDGHSFNELQEAFEKTLEQKKPVLIVATTTIGKGSPNKANSHKVHGAPLGEDEVLLTKQSLGIPDEEFYIFPAVKEYFRKHLEKQKETYLRWQKMYKQFQHSKPEDFAQYSLMQENKVPDNIEGLLSEIPIQEKEAGRAVSHKVLQLLSKHLPQFIGGSADLSCSDKSAIESEGVMTSSDFTAKNIKYGIREFAMGAMTAGLAQTGYFLPYCATFLVFSDYMRNAIRLTALMKLQVIYPLTHDSIFLGEDGPTHQPVEHYASLRAIPGLQFFRPADAREVKMSYVAALRYQGPSVIALSRQGLRLIEGTEKSCDEGMSKGAYIVYHEKEGQLDYSLMATGSELSLALDVAKTLEKLGKNVRVISMPCWELFNKQSSSYKEQVLGDKNALRISIEAGISQGWHRYIGAEGLHFGVEEFGASAPAGELSKEFGLNVDSIVQGILSHN